MADGIIPPVNLKTYLAGEPLCPRNPRKTTKGECAVDPRDETIGAGSNQTFPAMHTAGVGATRLRYLDQSGWSLVYPRRFHARAFTVHWSRSSSEGASFSNFGPAPSPGDVWDGRPPGVPRDGILFELTAGSGGATPQITARETPFPLSLSEFVQRSWSSSRSVRYEEYSFQADGGFYFASVWIGTRSPAQDRRALAEIVRSVHFPPLRTGGVAGPFVVLRRAASYPVGSVTRFDRSTFPSVKLPFYLVHDGKGFHAIAWPAGLYPAKYKPPCNVRLDSSRREFFCPNGGRWDLEGRVIVNTPGARQPEALEQNPASISHDGYVMVTDSLTSSSR